MAWTAERTTTFVKTSRNQPNYVPFLNFAYTKLRRGAVYAAKWVKIAFATGRIEIVQQPIQHGWAIEIQDETKTSSGDRVVFAVEPVRRALAKLRKNQQNQKQAAGERWIETGLVFTTETGTPIHPSTATNALREIADRAGLPQIRLHDLRHGTATHTLTAGVDMKTVSDMLGHSTTADTSVVDELKRAAADKIADQFAVEDDEHEDDEYGEPDAA